MHRTVALILLATAAVALGAEPPSQNDRADWPTLHGDLQRSGFYRQFPGGPLEIVWRKELWRELTAPRAEIIVSDGLAFIGTYAGRMIAWDAVTGAERWIVQSGGAIGHSPSVARGILYFGSMDRKMRAIEVATGKERWAFEAPEGIWSSPVVTGGRLFFGDRGGTFFALDADDGAIAWKYQTRDRIIAPASISEDGQRLLFGSEDMHLYCLAVNDGTLLWKSRKLAGASLRDYAPFIANNLVIVTTNPVKDFHAILEEHQRMLIKASGFTGKDPRYIPEGADGIEKEQELIVAFLRANPDEQTFYAFRIADGSEPWVAPILYTGGLHNPPAPPCRNVETGEVFVQLRSAYGTWDGGGEVRPLTCFGRLDPATGRVALIGHGYLAKSADRPPGAQDVPWGTFAYIGDETQALSCAPGLLFSNHQGNLGALDLKSGRVSNRFGRRDSYAGAYGAANFGWEDKGGYEKAGQAGQPYGLINEWHGPARSIASVANGRVYYHSGSQVLCLQGRETK